MIREQMLNTFFRSVESTLMALDIRDGVADKKISASVWNEYAANNGLSQTASDDTTVDCGIVKDLILNNLAKKYGITPEEIKYMKDKKESAEKEQKLINQLIEQVSEKQELLGEKLMEIVEPKNTLGLSKNMQEEIIEQKNNIELSMKKLEDTE